MNDYSELVLLQSSGANDHTNKLCSAASSGLPLNTRIWVTFWGLQPEQRGGNQSAVTHMEELSVQLRMESHRAICCCVSGDVTTTHQPPTVTVSLKAGGCQLTHLKDRGSRRSTSKSTFTCQTLSPTSIHLRLKRPDRNIERVPEAYLITI